MPATVTTKEPLEQGISPEAIAGLISLRMQAGAIRCWQAGGFLMTEWNVLGQNDEGPAK
jgi:hypothetical protein